MSFHQPKSRNSDSKHFFSSVNINFKFPNIKFLDLNQNATGRKSNTFPKAGIKHSSIRKEKQAILGAP